MNARTNSADVRDLKEGDVMPRNEVMVPEQSSSVGMVARGEYDAAIADARAHPRSIEKARREMLDLCCLNEQTAQECLYAVSRDGKVIEGPSIRMAEIIAYCWRNYQVGSRIVAEGADMVTVQGVYRDMERGGAIFSEVSRRIVNKRGQRYSVDMIVTTTNAAQAVAKRNAITSGVPRALWWDVYVQARKVAAGDVKTLATKRADAVKAFQVYGITPEQIYAKLGRAGESEVTRDDLVLLYGIFTSIKDEELTPEEAFPAVAEKKAEETKEPPLTTEAGEEAAKAKMEAHGLGKTALGLDESGRLAAAKPWLRKPDAAVQGELGHLSGHAEGSTAPTPATPKRRAKRPAQSIE